MHLTLKASGLSTGAALREHVERRVRFAVGRFGAGVSEVTVRLSDANGPRGGVDKVCQIVADLPRVGRLVVEDADADAYAAVDRAAGRLGRAAARAIDRRRDTGARRPEWPQLQRTLARRDPVFGME
jgi:ribosome-associated translation inhibitor RaiA